MRLGTKNFKKYTFLNFIFCNFFIQPTVLSFLVFFSFFFSKISWISIQWPLMMEEYWSRSWNTDSLVYPPLLTLEFLVVWFCWFLFGIWRDFTISPLRNLFCFRTVILFYIMKSACLRWCFHLGLLSQLVDNCLRTSCTGLLAECKDDLLGEDLFCTSEIPCNLSEVKEI